LSGSRTQDHQRQFALRTSGYQKSWGR